MRHTFYNTKLASIYGSEQAARLEFRLDDLIESYQGIIPEPADSILSGRDSILITYGDQLNSAGEVPLKTLTDFCQIHLSGVVSGIHILPFFPWSSDDGFSVKDYLAVEPDLGDWNDIECLGRSFRLMFDGVINHASVQGDWFQAFLRNEMPYRDYFLTVQRDADLSKVVRPRTLPLLTEFETANGPRWVWTTFSADQADLDYHNPDVLLKIIDVLLTYASHGAQFVRLDAIAYLWKEIGTSCIHLPQTHAIIQLLRSVFDQVAPHVKIITETNVPHPENISYFGNGLNEAQLVYNFALPPLVLHTFLTGDSSVLSQWVAGLEYTSDRTTFFNFLASHDGIGLNAARGIIPSTAIDDLCRQTEAHGGLISYKNNNDGTQSPYELNINYFDALSDPAGEESLETKVDRFMAAQVIMLSLRGVPGIYFHSMFGSRNWEEGVRLTGMKRSINRQKFQSVDLETILSDPTTRQAQIFHRYRSLLMQRASLPGFDPYGEQKILDLGPGIFALKRTLKNGDHPVFCLVNVTNRTQTSGTNTLKPYDAIWINRI